MTDGQPAVYSVRTAAQLLSDELDMRLTRQQLFDHLIAAGWARRHDEGYTPTALAVIDNLAAVQPSRVPATGVVWDQLVITTAGLDRLRADLDSRLLPPNTDTRNPS